ncbi:MAG: ABC transporter permease subunit [Thermoplasmatota archaeon]
MKRPPGTEYREYEKKFRSRFYRLFRLFLNNFSISLKNKWAIVVIVLAYMFVFINVMIFAMGGETLVYDPGREGEVSTRFHVARIPGGDPVTYVSLGDIVILNYTVTNRGDTNATIEIETAGPNPGWFSEAIVFPPLEELGPGDTAYIMIGVVVPQNLGNYTWIPGFDGISEEELDPEIVEAADRFNIDIESYLGMYQIHSFDMFTHTRAVNINIYSKLNRSLTDEDHPESGDDRYLVSSVNELFTLKDNGTGAGIDPAADKGPISIEVLNPSVKKIKAGDHTSFTLRITNSGSEPSRVGIDVLSSTVGKDLWSFEVKKSDGELNRSQYVELAGYETRDVEIKLEPGFQASYRDHDLIITATDLDGNVHMTNTTTLRIQVSGYVTEDRGKQILYEYFWTGENYDKYLWLIFLSAVAGSGLIANDYKSNAISLYLSRPITRRDYIIGKAAALTGVLSIVSFLPAIIIFTAAMALTSVSLTYIIEHLWILGALILSYVFTLMVFIPFCLAVSSSTKKGIIAGAGIFSTLIFTSTISDILYAIFDVKYLRLINIFGNFSALFRLLFDLEYSSSSYGYEWYYPAVVLILISAASCGVIYYRITREVK